MRITIPTHLRNLDIVDQMYKMMVEYTKEYGDISSDSNSLENRAYDFIYEFLNIVLPDNDEPTNRYLASLFYKSKGTLSILDYLEKYLGLIYKEKPIYNIDRLELNFESVSGSNLLNFTPALINFLNALLYFDELNILIDKFKLQISSSLSNKSSNMCIFYKESNFEFK